MGTRVRWTRKAAVDDNEVMEFLRMRWGMLQEQRVYLDTERVAELDAQLAAAGDAVSRAAAASAG